MAQVAEASLRVGLKAQARSWYVLALQIDPTSREVQMAVYRLDHEEAAAAIGPPKLQASRAPRE